MGEVPTLTWRNRDEQETRVLLKTVNKRFCRRRTKAKELLV